MKIFFIFFFTTFFPFAFAAPPEKQDDKNVKVSWLPFMDFVKVPWFPVPIWKWQYRLTIKPLEALFGKLFGGKTEPVEEVKVQEIPAASSPSKLSLQVLYPDEDDIGSRDVVLEWLFPSRYARRAETVEVFVDGLSDQKFHRLLRCKEGDDCERCEITDLAPGTYDWMVQVTFGDGSKHLSDPGFFKVKTDIETDPKHVKTLFPKTDPEENTFRSGTVIPFRWRLGKQLSQVKTVVFHVKQGKADSIRRVLDCEKVDCRRLDSAVTGYGLHKWTVEATGHDGGKVTSNEGHFTLTN